MARQFSPKAFFREAPNVLLDRYFHERGLLKEINIASLEETDVDPVFRAWSDLPNLSRAQADEDFHIIDSVANEDGILAILEEAHFHDEDLEPAFAHMGGFHDKAFWTFLEHPDYLEIAARFREADERPKNYWRDRNGIPAVPPRADPAGCEDLASVLKFYFRQKEGRGQACFVDLFRRDTRYYYFAYPEDRGRTLIEYEGSGDRLQRRLHRPVFEVVFVYDPDKGMLSTYYEGKAAVVRDLQQLFAREILVMNLPNSQQDDLVYDLNSLKHRGFRFRYNAESGIVDIRVKQLKLAVMGKGRRRITVDVDPTGGSETLYDLLDDVLNTGAPHSRGNNIPLSLVNVTKVGIKAYFAPDFRRRWPTKTFYVSYPNSCSLKHEDKDEVLRQMLIDSGLEPKSRTAGPAAA